jgi:hypothetical protein
MLGGGVLTALRRNVADAIPICEWLTPSASYLDSAVCHDTKLYTYMALTRLKSTTATLNCTPGVILIRSPPTRAMVGPVRKTPSVRLVGKIRCWIDAAVHVTSQLTRHRKVLLSVT